MYSFVCIKLHVHTLFKLVFRVGFLSGIDFGPTPETALLSKAQKIVGIGVCGQKGLCKTGWPACGVLYASLCHNRGCVSVNVLHLVICKEFCVRAFRSN